MKWLFYLLEANLYLSVSYLFYQLVLRRLTFYRINRWYLIGMIVTSFGLPLLKTASAGPDTGNTVVAQVSGKGSFLVTPQKNATRGHTGSGASVYKRADFIFYLYVIAALIGTIRLLSGIFKVVRLYFGSAKYREDGIVYVRLEQCPSAFSFFHWLFYDPLSERQRTIFVHEKVHIAQRHSYDLLLVEAVVIISWFNPIVYLLKKDIRLNHEYLADETAGKSMPSLHDYAVMLINCQEKAWHPKLSSTLFSKHLLRQRLLQLNQRKTGRKQLFRYLAIVPLTLALMLCASFVIRKDYGFIIIHTGLPPVSKNFGPRLSVTVLAKLTVPKSGTPIQRDSNQAHGTHNDSRLSRLRGKSGKKLNVNQMATVNHSAGQQLLSDPKSKTARFNRVAADSTHTYMVSPINVKNQVSMNFSRSDTARRFQQQAVTYQDGKISYRPTVNN
jgi:hypothetical protein